MPGFQSTRLATEGALEPFLFLYTDDSIQGNPETCNQSSMMLNYEVKNTYNLAYSLASFGKKVLAVDFDSQANLTTCFGVEDTAAISTTIGHLIML